jgi:hypothetical protein
MKKYEQKAKILREFIQESGIDVEYVVSKYEYELFLDGQSKKQIFSDVILGNPSEFTLNYLENRLNGKQFKFLRDKRTPAEYGIDLVLGWLKEDSVLLSLEKIGLSVSLDGADRNREFLRSKDIKSNSDLIVSLNESSGVGGLGMSYEPVSCRTPAQRTPPYRKIEVVYDATGYWKSKDKCDLRGDKFNKIKSEQGIILGMSLLDKTAFHVDLQEEIDTQYVPSHWCYGGKSAYSLLGIRKLLKPVSQTLIEIKSLIQKQIIEPSIC